MPLRHSFSPPDNARLAHLCAPLDEHLHTICQALGLKISRRSEQFSVTGATANARQGVAFSLFTADDVVRHPLVARIVQAYNKDRS